VFRISGRRYETEVVTNAAAIQTNPMRNIAAAALPGEKQIAGRKSIRPYLARERFAAQHDVRVHVRR
jgi:hypothetical protein